MAGADLDADYAKAGFGGHLRFGQRPALLVVDVVAAYLDPASPLYLGGAEAVACFARLIAACRAKAIAVVYTQVVYSAGGRDGGLF